MLKKLVETKLVFEKNPHQIQEHLIKEYWILKRKNLLSLNKAMFYQYYHESQFLYFIYSQLHFFSGNSDGIRILHALSPFKFNQHNLTQYISSF